MRRFAAAVALAFGCQWLPAWSAENNATIASAPGTATLDTSTAGSCRPTVVERFSRHLVHQLPPHVVPPAPSGKYVLVTQDFEIGQGCFEGFSPARITLTAKHIDLKSGKVAPDVVWTFSAEGIEGRQATEPYLYEILMPGCCGAEPTRKYYSLDTGGFVGSATMPPLLASFDTVSNHLVLSSQRRMLTVESGIASSPQRAGEAPAMATIYFSDLQEIKEVLTITSPDADKFGWSVERSGFVDRGDTREVAIGKDASIKMHLRLVPLGEASPVDITLPVSSGGFDERNAVIQGMKNITLTKAVTK